MATTIAHGEVTLTGRQPRLGWAIGGLVALALVGVVVAAVAVLSPSSGPADRERTAPIYTQEEATVIGLVADGVLPDSVLAQEPFRTKQLVAEGLIPRAALLSGVAAAVSLYCPDERAVMAAVAAGVVPKETLDGEPYRTKRLIAQGLVPREAVEPCS